MATARTKSDATEALKQVTYLASALKAPRITEAAARLADHARDAGWTHEEYLAAILDREVAARNAFRGPDADPRRRFPARKTIEEFDWDAQPAVRQQVASLASGGFLAEARNVVLLGPPGPGKTTWPLGSGSPQRTTAPGAVCDRDRLGPPGSPTPTGRATLTRAHPNYADTD